MKISVCTSKQMYNKAPKIIKQLKESDPEITLPDSFKNPMQEERIKKSDKEIRKSRKAEIFKAWELNKKIFLINPIPNNMLKDKIEGFNPAILNEEPSKII